MNSIVAAQRFFFTHTLARPDPARRLVRTKHTPIAEFNATVVEGKQPCDSGMTCKTAENLYATGISTPIRTG